MKFWIGIAIAFAAACAMVGFVGHPWEGLDVYAYAGIEQADAKYFNSGATLFGYGNPGFSNAGCLITTPGTFGGATPSDGSSVLRSA